MDHRTRRVYENLTADRRCKICLNRRVTKISRHASHVVVEDAAGVRKTLDDVIFGCGADQMLAMLRDPTRLERYTLSSIRSSIRHDASLHREAVVHFDASVLPDDEPEPLEARRDCI